MQIEPTLIKACLAEDQIAQKQLYTLLLPYLRAVASRYLRDTSYVKDVLQEAFVNIFRNLKHYDADKAPLDKWATKIVINNCLNFNERIIGKPRDEFVLEKHEITITSTINQHISDEHLLFILKQMPSDYFEVFNLYIIDEYPHLEIAEILSISPESSRKRLSRGRAWLQKTFKDRPEYLGQLDTLIHTQN